ncbi:MAG TPA: hypothetical protein VFE71_05535 [Bacteroidales bacterium]|nr:hypothetical protein [Bacteroidales bacterium]
MDAATAKFVLIYVIAIVIVDSVTLKIGIPLKWRIVYAFIVTFIFIILKLAMGIK